MRFSALISSTLAMTAFALPALAQGAALPAPSRSESSAAQPEWYRQYAVTTPAENRPTWQAEPVDDFSVVIGGDQRWQLNFDKLSRPSATASPFPREQVQAGASFRITPRFSVGGEVSVGAEELAELPTKNSWDNRDVEAGIRLKSAFKF